MFLWSWVQTPLFIGWKRISVQPSQNAQKSLVTFDVSGKPDKEIFLRKLSFKQLRHLRQVREPLVPGLYAADRRSLLGAVDHLAPLAPVVDPGRHGPMNEPGTGLTNGLKVDGSDIVVF